MQTVAVMATVFHIRLLDTVSMTTDLFVICAEQDSNRVFLHVNFVLCVCLEPLIV